MFSIIIVQVAVMCSVGFFQQADLHVILHVCIRAQPLFITIVVDNSKLK